MDDRAEKFRRLGQRVLEMYDREPGSLELVGDMNYGAYGIRKFAVRGQDGLEKFLMSIHHPYGGNDIIEQKDSFESLLLWLEALCRDTDLVVQTPILSPSGEHLTEVSMDEEISVLVSLLEWVPGDVISDDDQLASLTPALMRDMGKVLAKIHIHASQWEPDRKIVRRESGIEQVAASLEDLRQVLPSGRIRQKDFATIEAACDKVCNHLSSIEKTSESWGLTHGDFHGQNCLLFEGEVRPIDFDFCKFQYYLYDVAYSFKYIEPHRRQEFLDGYTDILSVPSSFIDTAEALLISQRTHRWGILTRSSGYGMVPGIVANEFVPYINDQPLLFSAPVWDWAEDRLRK